MLGNNVLTASQVLGNAENNVLATSQDLGNARNRFFGLPKSLEEVLLGILSFFASTGVKRSQSHLSDVVSLRHEEKSVFSFIKVLVLYYFFAREVNKDIEVDFVDFVDFTRYKENVLFFMLVK
ncbi:MAG: hypothetical protein KBT20_03775 [Bacteroidales bacterium]|nr:hypothetical protein [Candidatus Liminaster caballi]